MGYVEDLRSLIGHRRIILNGCIVIIENALGEILMQQRKYPQGKWGFPGGLMELGESTEETAKREVYEETGLTLGKLRLFGVYSGKNYLCTAENGDEYFVVTTVYTSSEYQGEMIVDYGESLKFEWVSVNNLPKNIAGTHKEITRDYLLTRQDYVQQ